MQRGLNGICNLNSEVSLLTLLIVEPFRAPWYAAQLTASTARSPSHTFSLGNDPELDPDREPEPPTKAIDKPAARAGKRNAPAEAPVRDAGRGGRGGHRDGFGGNEGGTSSFHSPFLSHQQIAVALLPVYYLVMMPTYSSLTTSIRSIPGSRCWQQPESQPARWRYVELPY